MKGGHAPHLKQGLCIITHIDADSFYAQVEHRRLGIPRDKPLAVQQWNGLIAVNYPARAFGVRRGDRVEIAKQKCPELVCVHVETRDESGSSAEGTADRSSQKACLARYREASDEVLTVMQRFCSRVERASIDEAYLDLTAEVAKDDEQLRQQGHNADGFTADELVAIDGHICDPLNALDRLLLLGARLVGRIRAAVWDETGFTVSAGIAGNKMLAKLASARNKPNKQTVVPSSAISTMLGTIPLKDMRGLGGKLGDAVVAFTGPSCKTAADLQRYTEEELVAKFGQKDGTWLYRMCRGVDDEAVVAKTKTQSMLAYKSFAPVNNMDGVKQWLHVLAAELHGRLERERSVNHRRATTLVLQYRGHLKQDHLQNWVANQVADLTPMLSRSMAMPSASGTTGVPSEDSLVRAALTLFGRCGGDQALPCTRLALGASGFVEVPRDDHKGSILSFMGRKVPSSAGGVDGGGGGGKGDEAAVARCSSGDSSPMGVEKAVACTRSARDASDIVDVPRDVHIGPTPSFMGRKTHGGGSSVVGGVIAGGGAAAMAAAAVSGASAGSGDSGPVNVCGPVLCDGRELDDGDDSDITAVEDSEGMESLPVPSKDGDGIAKEVCTGGFDCMRTDASTVQVEKASTVQMRPMPACACVQPVTVVKTDDGQLAMEPSASATRTTKHCSKCGQVVVDGPEWQEHMDFHMASDLQAAYGGLPRVDSHESASSNGSVKRSHSGGGGGSGGARKRGGGGGGRGKGKEGKRPKGMGGLDGYFKARS